MEQYTTSRLILKRVTIEDAPFIVELYNDPNFIKYIGDKGIKNNADAEQYIQTKFLSQFEDYGYGNYIVVHKEDQKKIGAVGIFHRPNNTIPDIGFSFLSNYEGKGYGFEASSLLKTIALSEFGLQKISAYTSEDNIASQKLIEKLGLSYVGMVNFEGHTEKLRYYEL